MVLGQAGMAKPQEGSIAQLRTHLSGSSLRNPQDIFLGMSP